MRVAVRRTPKVFRLSRPLAIWLIATLAIVAIGGVPALLPRLGVCTSGWLPGDETLASGPYLQRVTGAEATIRWWNERDDAGVLTYGEAGRAGTDVTPTGGALRAVHLAGLRPGTRYDYRVRGEAGEGAGSFLTDLGPNATITVGVLGDSGTGGDAQHDVARVLAGMAPDLVLHTGDVVYPDGSLCAYQAGFFDPYADMLPHAPFYPTAGNHDLQTDDGRPYGTVFDLPARDPGETNRHYSFDYGPLHVAVVDSERYAGGDPTETEIAAQRAWLEADLQAATRPWTVVVLHRPPYASTIDADEPAVRAALTPLVAAHGVDLVLSGHAHNYERVGPVDGVTYVVSGGGGAELHGVAAPGPRTAAVAAVHHAVKLVVGPDTLVVEAIDRDGVVFDRAALPPR